jgi:hypothetical protein
VAVRVVQVVVQASGSVERCAMGPSAASLGMSLALGRGSVAEVMTDVAALMKHM